LIDCVIGWSRSILPDRNALAFGLPRPTLAGARLPGAARAALADARNEALPRAVVKYCESEGCLTCFARRDRRSSRAHIDFAVPENEGDRRRCLRTIR
jgi:hypothetical protein